MYDIPGTEFRCTALMNAGGLLFMTEGVTALLGGGVGAAVTGAVGDGVGILLGCAVAGRHGSHVQFLPLQVFWTFGTAYRDALH